jgi:hypothetical protein
VDKSKASVFIEELRSPIAQKSSNNTDAKSTQQQLNPAEVVIPVKDYSTATNVIQNFENPTFEGRKPHVSTRKFTPISKRLLNALTARLKRAGLAKEVVTDKVEFDRKLD